MNILLTGIGRWGYLVKYFKQSLNGAGRVFCSSSEYSTAFELADGFLLSPLSYDDNYIDLIIEFCNQNDIKVILSLMDLDVWFLARNEKRFAESSINLISAGEKFVNICNDKWKFYQFTKKINIQSPKTFLTIEEVANEIKSKSIEFPLIIKPRWGTGSIGIFHVNNLNELRVLYERVNDLAFKTILKFESESTPEDPVIIQKFIDGDEFGLDVINDLNGQFVAVIAKRKIKLRAGETELGEIVDNSPFVELARLVSEGSKHKGILSIDCIVKGGVIYVIEINCRISGHYPISHVAGVDFPGMLVNWLKGKKHDERMLKHIVGLKVIKNLEPVIYNDTIC